MLSTEFLKKKETPPQSPIPKSRLIWIVGFTTLVRLFINTARRFAYPFAPALSRGLGVSLTAVTSMIAVNQVTGLFALVFGPLGDKWGYRLMMLAGVGSLTVGMCCGGLFPYYGTVLLALFMAGIGKTLFDPALQAFVGSRIPYERRGMAIGICETAWAGASLLGIPLVGILIARFGWQSPFFFLGAMGIIGALGIVLLIPANEQNYRSTQKSSIYIRAISQLVKQRTPLGAMGFVFLLNAANDNLFVVYGAWLEQSFKLGIVALGMATTIIGVAELLGEIITAFAGDRMGLPRLIFIGTIVSTACYIAFPTIGINLPFALGALFFVFFAFEVTIVTSISLCTELLPEARATMMAGFHASAGLGRVVGALIGGPVWITGGIYTTGIVSGVMTGLALIVLMWGIRGWKPNK